MLAGSSARGGRVRFSDLGDDSLPYEAASMSALVGPTWNLMRVPPVVITRASGKSNCDRVVLAELQGVGDAAPGQCLQVEEIRASHDPQYVRLVQERVVWFGSGWHPWKNRGRARGSPALAARGTESCLLRPDRAARTLGRCFSLSATPPLDDSAQLAVYFRRLRTRSLHLRSIARRPEEST